MFPMPPVTPTVHVPQVSNGLIAFTAQPDGSMDIYTMNPDGGDIKRTATNDGFAPVWTRDSDHIIFTTWNEDRRQRLYVMEIDGSNNQPFFDGWVETFVWSPDGTKAAISVIDETDGTGPVKFDIYILNADGTDAYRLPTYESDLAVAIEPAWSPDGKKIVFAANRGEYPDDPQDIYMINTDGTQLRQLTHNTDVERIPQWSPDGKRIFFASSEQYQSHDQLKAYVMDVDGSNIQPLIEMPVDSRVINYTSEAWPISPDSTLMLLPTRQDEKYFMNVVDTSTYSVLFTLENWVRALWSPDGKQILYYDYFYKRGADYSTYHTMNADGTEDHEFKSPFGWANSFAWQPVWK